MRSGNESNFDWMCMLVTGGGVQLGLRRGLTLLSTCAKVTHGYPNPARPTMTAQFYRHDALMRPNLTQHGANLAQVYVTLQCHVDLVITAVPQCHGSVPG